MSPTRRRSRTSNTATLMASLRKEREDEIKTIYNQIRLLAIQQGKCEQIIKDANDDTEETESSFRKYQTAVIDKNKCIKNINKLHDTIKKRRNSITFRGGRQRRRRKKHLLQ